MSLTKKLYDYLFKASFVTYIVYILKALNTRQNGDDFIFFVSIITIGLLYQFCYIVFLRKQNDVKLRHAIARYFLYALNTISLTTILYGADLYLYGYDVYSWILPEYIKTVYKMEALRESWYFIVTPLWAVNALYVVIYYLVSRKLKENSKE